MQDICRAMNSAVPFNRTSLELKLLELLIKMYRMPAFNRTSLELKRRPPMFIGAYSAKLLIAPVWN